MISKLSAKFKNKQLLEQALTHPSYTKLGKDYERLEFLGDHVLGIVIAESLYKEYPQEDEGRLTKRLAGLICGDTLVQIATKLNIGKHIKMATSEEAGGGRTNRATLENATEALIAAIYLDQGLEAAREFILANWQDLITNMAEPPKDAKSSLQEWAQGRGLPLPEYTVTSTTGPSHAPVFVVEVKVEGLEPQKGEGSSKRAAEQEAAKLALKSTS